MQQYSVASDSRQVIGDIKQTTQGRYGAIANEGRASNYEVYSLAIFATPSVP